MSAKEGLEALKVWFHDTVATPATAGVRLTVGVAILIGGNTGTGKTILVRDRLLNGIDREVYNQIFLNFSAQTSA